MVPIRAHAQDQNYDEETIAKVNNHFETGANLFYEEDYEGAIREFEAGHALIPNAIFLYNISLAYERMGQTDKALETAEEAEELGGLNDSERVSNRARIVALGSQQHAVEIADDAATPDPLFRFTRWGWIGSGLVVGGVIALGATAGIDRALSDEVGDFKAAAANDDQAEYDRLKDEIDRRQTGARVLFVLGTIGVVGGAGLIVYDLMFNPNNRPADTPAVTVAPTRGGAALQLRWQFR